MDVALRDALARQAKRYKAEVDREGVCCACIHRARTNGRWHCQNTPARVYPKCTSDGGVGRFTFDPAVMARFQDRGNGTWPT